MERFNSNTCGIIYECCVCGSEYTNKQYLKNHMKIRHGMVQSYNMLYKCKKRYADFVVKASENPHKCDACKSTISHIEGILESLKSHMKTRTNEKTYMCRFCHARLRGTSQLKSHTKQQIDEEPYPCHLCCKSFAHPYTLKMHLKMHSGAE